LVVGKFVQAEHIIRAADAESYASINALMTKVLDYLLASA
jgi:hypothetical protein